MPYFDGASLAELLAIAGRIVEGFIDKSRNRKADLMENVFMGMEMIKELTHNHMNAIDLVVTPILKNDDFLSTSNNYQTLVNNQYYPRGYGEAIGLFEAALVQKPFKKGSLSEFLNNVTTELRRFQFAAFILKADSYAMADQFDMASKLWTHLCNRNKQNTLSTPDDLRNQVYDRFRASIIWIFSEQGKSIPSINTKSIQDTKDLLSLVSQWCLQWQRFVKHRLYGGRNLDYAIGKLQIERRRS